MLAPADNEAHFFVQLFTFIRGIALAVRREKLQAQFFKRSVSKVVTLSDPGT